MDNIESESKFLFYNSEKGNVSVQVIIDDKQNTVWVTQKSMADIFGVDRSVISKHIINILNEGELQEIRTCVKIAQVRKEGTRDIKRDVDFYNLDMIIAVGYRVNSYQATQFRIWATSVLKEYLLKGFALDDERLKQGNSLFDKDFFGELLERIREIRSSERLFYQKVTDLYATSIDYDVNSPITQRFYAMVQNKLHWAIHHHTAAELINLRANAESPNMGLTSWKNSKQGGKIIRTDVVIAKNYLSELELDGLNRLVSMYLDHAESLVKREIALTMEDWAKRLDLFLQFNEYEILTHAGKISHEIAVKLAGKEFDKYRIIQDRQYISDFDRTIEQVKSKGNIHTERAGDIDIEVNLPENKPSSHKKKKED